MHMDVTTMKRVVGVGKDRGERGDRERTSSEGEHFKF
jgi:hypothetical protein